MMLMQLKQISFLSNLDTSILEDQIQKQNISIKKYAKGTTVYNHGELCTSLDFVISGNLISYNLSINGSETMMFEFKKDSIIGANILFRTNNSYPLNIYCLKNSEILHIKKEAVDAFLHNHSFVMNYITSLSQNSLGMNQKIIMFSKKNLRENIIEYLKAQSAIQNSNSIVLPISKKELADYFGVQRPSLFREFKKMKEDNLISVNNRAIDLHFIK